MNESRRAMLFGRFRLSGLGEGVSFLCKMDLKLGWSPNMVGLRALSLGLFDSPDDVRFRLDRDRSEPSRLRPPEVLFSSGESHTFLMT